MKIIRKDNFDRDTMAEFVICRFPPSVSEKQAQAMAEVLNISAQEYYYEAVEDDKPLNFPSWWEPEDCHLTPISDFDRGLLALLKDRLERPDDEIRMWNGVEENVLLMHFIDQLSGKI